MSPGLRRFALTVHLVCSVGWIGAVVAYLALGIAATARPDAQTVHAAWIGMELTGWYAIVPLAMAALLTGLIMSLGTPWGLFRHYWVIVSLALTVLCTVVLVLHMPSVSATADMLRAMDMSAPSVAGVATPAAEDGRRASREARGGMGGDLFHPGAGLAVLLVVMGLNVYKPRGPTPYGWRKQREERGSAAAQQTRQTRQARMRACVP